MLIRGCQVKRNETVVMARPFPERTFYAAKVRPVSARAVADIDRKTAISVEWKANYSCFGARRLHKHLRRHGHTIARCTT